MSQVRLEIDGMSCGHCVHAVKEALRAVSGVSDVDVQIGSATVTCDSAVSVSDLVDAVADAGYSASEAPTSASG
jgi:copper chaperone